MSSDEDDRKDGTQASNSTRGQQGGGEHSGEPPNDVTEIHSIKLPVFWPARPKLWFIQAEVRFHKQRITSDLVKYYDIIDALDARSLEQVADIVEAPPATDKYLNLKTKLIERFSESEEKQLTKLLTEIELDDKKPTQLLREMRACAGPAISDGLLWSLWKKRLPTNVRCVLSACSEPDLTKAAEIADKIIEASAQTCSVTTAPAVVSAVNKNPGTLSLETRMAALERGMLAIERSFVELSTHVKSKQTNQKDAGTREPRSRQRSSSRTSTKGADICFFHTKFGAKAKRCRSPCSFKGLLASEN